MARCWRWAMAEAPERVQGLTREVAPFGSGIWTLLRRRMLPPERARSYRSHFHQRAKCWLAAAPTRRLRYGTFLPSHENRGTSSTLARFGRWLFLRMDSTWPAAAVTKR